MCIIILPKSCSALLSVLSWTGFVLYIEKCVNLIDNISEYSHDRCSWTQVGKQSFLLSTLGLFLFKLLWIVYYFDLSFPDRILTKENKTELKSFLPQVPQLNQLEQGVENLWKSRAARLLQRRQQDVIDQDREFMTSRWFHSFNLINMGLVFMDRVDNKLIDIDF